MKNVISDEYKNAHNEILAAYWEAQKLIGEKFEKLLADVRIVEEQRILALGTTKFKVGDRVIHGHGCKNALHGEVIKVEISVGRGINDDYYADRTGPGQYVEILDERDEEWDGDYLRRDAVVRYVIQPDPSPVKKLVRSPKWCTEASLTAE